jgi:DNA-binding NtrC family response regulator
MNSPLIYIIDGSSSYRKIIETCLAALNVLDIKMFDDGESCFASMELSPDIIILDYNLGEGKWNGLEFMEEYSRAHKNVNYIFLSSSTKIEIAVEAVRMGARDYILKSKSGITRLAKQIDMVRNSLQARKIEHKHLDLFL